MKKRDKGDVEVGRKYTWRSGASIYNRNKLDVQAVGEEIARLTAERGERMEAEELPALAADPTSPLHEAFPWDDTEAAEMMREQIARNLLGSYTITIKKENKPPIVYRANCAVVTKENHRKCTYGATIELMNDEEMRALILRQAIQRLIAFKRQYANLSELAIVFASIDKVMKKTA